MMFALTDCSADSSNDQVKNETHIYAALTLAARSSAFRILYEETHVLRQNLNQDERRKRVQP